MQTGLYNDRDTLAHRLHPGIKTLCLVLFFVMAYMLEHPAYALVAVAGAAFLVGATRAERSVSRVWVFLVVIFVFSTLLWSLFKRGGAAPESVGPFGITRESLLYGFGLGMRLDAMLVAAVVFLSCTTVEAFIAGLRSLGAPFPATFALGLAFRFVPTLFATTATVVQAQRSRGLALDRGTPAERARRYVPLLVPIFVATIRNTNLLAMALESRAFSPGRPRTSVQQLSYQLTDWATLGVFVFLASIAVGLSFAGVGKVLFPTG